VFGWIIPMAIFKFDCFIPYCCFLGILGFGMLWLWSLYRLALENVNFGYPNDSNSYIYFLILKLTGIHFPEKWIDLTTAIVFFTSYFISIYFAVKKIILNQS
jgi:hypothetical protein